MAAFKRKQDIADLSFHDPYQDVMEVEDDQDIEPFDAPSTIANASIPPEDEVMEGMEEALDNESSRDEVELREAQDALEDAVI